MSESSHLDIETASKIGGDIDKDLRWLSNIIQYQTGDADKTLITRIENEGEIHPPKIWSESFYGQFIADKSLNAVERGIFIMSLAVHLRPSLFDPLLKKAREYQYTDTRFGGIVSDAQVPFLPTGETAIFLLTNGTVEERLVVLEVLSPQHWLFDEEVLEFNYTDNLLPHTFAGFYLSKDYVQLLTKGVANKPDYSSNFPASLVRVALNWEDLVISQELRKELTDIENWIRFEGHILNSHSLSKKIKRGYKAVFYGPSGTGKTLTAGLIGKKFGKDVYRIDLSQISSKYIGETEKNLERLFKQARNKNWILFFDEGETLFGKRGNSGQSNERYANQQVGFLLQKIEDHPGVVILATNLKGNIDDAFLRRFQKMIYFDAPDSEYRLQLWQKAFEDTLPLSKEIDLKQIAKEHKLVGGQIVNIVKQSVLRVLGRDLSQISYSVLKMCIAEEEKKS